MKNVDIKEKIKLLIAKNCWSNHDLNGELYTFNVSDGPCGLRHVKNMEVCDGETTVPSISYPSIQVLANTWNVDLAKKMGNAIANDCIENDVDIILAPGVNIKRIPTCGRNFEYFSEDPLLAGVMAREYIKGVQEKHVGTSLKHFCCNNAEYSRVWSSSEVDERTLREIYLKQFEIACEAKPWTVMCSYNLVNGVRMSEHAKLYKILREEFGFDGVIISDWGAVKDIVASLNAGLDMTFPYEEKLFNDLFTAYEKGTLPLDKLEESVTRIIALANKCESEKKLRKIDMTIEERETVAKTIAEEGIVLLKNDYDILPLSDMFEIMVTGAAAKNYYRGGGSSEVKLRNPFVDLETALKKYFPDVTYAESTTWSRGHTCDIGNLRSATIAARKAAYSIICVGDNYNCESEGGDRLQIKLAKEEIDTIHEISKVARGVIVIVYAGSAIDMSDWIDDVDAVIYAGYGGEFVNEALAKVIAGVVNPSGKLTETFPLSLYDVPAMNAYRDAACVTYTEGLNVGYRYFNTFEKPVLFPFGYGLSYSEFSYSALKVTGKNYDYKVRFRVKNNSKRDGATVAQVYVTELDKLVYRPIRELKGFKKIFLKAGEAKAFDIDLDKSSFAYYSVAEDAWKVDKGAFLIEVCTDAEDEGLGAVIEIK